MLGTAMWVEIATRPIVCPSGVDCASVVGPSAPAPPTTFFTITVALSRFSRACAMMRAVRSVDAPGALGLISEISRAGHLLDWPIAGAATDRVARAAPPRSTLLRFMTQIGRAHV